MRRLILYTALALTACGIGAPTASAEGGGFFLFGEEHVAISGAESGGHQVTFVAPGLEEINCSVAYLSTSTATKVESLFFVPFSSECVIDPNGCGFTFKVAEAPTKETEQTIQLLCPSGKNLTITRGECTIALPPQIITGGMTYASASNLGRKALTIDFNAKLALSTRPANARAWVQARSAPCKGP